MNNPEHFLFWFQGISRGCPHSKSSTDVKLDWGSQHFHKAFPQVFRTPIKFWSMLSSHINIIQCVSFPSFLRLHEWEIPSSPSCTQRCQWEIHKKSGVVNMWKWWKIHLQILYSWCSVATCDCRRLSSSHCCELFQGSWDDLELVWSYPWRYIPTSS